MPVAEQIGVLLAVTSGVLDVVPLADITQAEEAVRRVVRGDERFAETILAGNRLGKQEKESFLGQVRLVLQSEWGETNE
jgi:F-type H+-transporting ATPase subunit alpha